MPSFDTPEPISVTLELGVGDVRLTASERTDTVVEVRPSDERDESDVRAAEQVRIDYTNGTLQVTGAKRAFDFSKKSRSVQVLIHLPSGSHLAAQVQLGDIRCVGQLGECRVKTTGNVWLDRTGPLTLHTGIGHVSAAGITGHVEISTGTGKIQIGEVDGSAVVKNSNGDTTIEAITGDARVRSANGAITVERAGAGVDAKTSNGTIRIGEVVRGSVVLGTAAGDLDIGVAEGTAAWLEVSTGFGHVRSTLESTSQPTAGDGTVEVRGRTSYGDIVIHRS